jgi:hypothetical protein
VENKERRITFGGRKTEGGNKQGEAVKPCTRCLFKPIERFLQTANMSRMGGVKKARRLLTVDGLLKMTMKEGILDVQLMNGPGVHASDAQDETDCGRLHHGAECLTIVHTLLLRESTDHPSCLVTGERAIRIEFVVKNPLPGNHVDTCRTRN